MLLTADRTEALTETEHWTASPAPAQADATAPPTGGRYGEGRGLRPFEMVLALLIPALVIAAMLQGGRMAARKSHASLVVLNLAPPPPPPPAAKAPPVPEKTLAPSAPTPILPVPRMTPLQPVQAAPAPAIAPTAPPAPPAPPAPAAAPAAIQSQDLGTRMVSATPPRYPTESRRRHEQGTVLLGLTLDVDGAVADIRVVRSSGYARLDEAALRAVRKWRWAPVLRDRQPVMVQGQVEIPFVLQG